MTTTNLDQIGTEAIRLMTGADRDMKKAQAHIKQVWDAYTAAEEAGTTIIVNGAKSKTEWAKLINRSTRYCQMIAKDGSRERSEKKDANRVRPMALLKELLTVVSMGTPKMVTDKASAICHQINWLPPEWKEEAEEQRKKKPKTEDDEMHPAAEALKKMLDATEPITIVGNAPKECNYTENEVAAMFTKGGK